MCDDNVFELVKLDPQRRGFYAPFMLIKHYGEYILIPVYSANAVTSVYKIIIISDLVVTAVMTNQQVMYVTMNI